VLERESLIEIPDDDMGEMPTHCVVPRMSGTRARSSRPHQGRRTQRGAAEAAARRREYDKLAQSGIISSGVILPRKEKEVTVSRPAPPVWRSILYVPGMSRSSSTRRTSAARIACWSISRTACSRRRSRRHASCWVKRIKKVARGGAGCTLSSRSTSTQSAPRSCALSMNFGTLPGT